MRKLLLAVVAMLSLVSLPTPVISPAAAATTLSRAEIKAMPIEQRPNRPGHFYGNTVRRRGR
jgi:hypothetical protein